MIRTKSSVRSKVIKARISEDEYQKIRAKRQASGLSESEFVRRVLLGCTPIIMGEIDDWGVFCGVAKLHETKWWVGWMAVTR